ncbi:MAG: 2'-5' RNA ligase family protein [Bacteroidota bacterium]|nr:2'-5' RNA ligase family protein [Bacteroidota bacterium]MDX5429431.1 2'-5' RNA ligase family protein [Bacteroidota bacterium]MDX5468222.1 2'-5' RNA ligase family protein [Bacteroidota bacterium]
MNHSLFFFALIPEQTFSDKVRAIQEELKSEFGLQYALRLNPHITLQAPFECQVEEYEKLQACAAKIQRKLHPLKLQAMGFGSFIQSVVFVEVEKEASLMKLQQEVANVLETNNCLSAGQRNNDYVPHITLAHRDLDSNIFQEVWKELERKNIKDTFGIEKLQIFKLEDGVWQEFMSMPMDMELA